MTHYVLMAVAGQTASERSGVGIVMLASKEHWKQRVFTEKNSDIAILNVLNVLIPRLEEDLGKKCWIEFITDSERFQKYINHPEKIGGKAKSHVQKLHRQLANGWHHQTCRLDPKHGAMPSAIRLAQLALSKVSSDREDTLAREIPCPHPACFKCSPPHKEITFDGYLHSYCTECGNSVCEPRQLSEFEMHGEAEYLLAGKRIDESRVGGLEVTDRKKTAAASKPSPDIQLQPAAMFTDFKRLAQSQDALVAERDGVRIRIIRPIETELAIDNGQSGEQLVQYGKVFRNGIWSTTRHINSDVTSLVKSLFEDPWEFADEEELP